MTLTFRCEKWLWHDKPWINSGDQLQMVENGFILDFDQLQVVGGTIFYITVNDNIWLAMTTDKQIGFRKTFAVYRHWIQDEVFTAISLLSLQFFN